MRLICCALFAMMACVGAFAQTTTVKGTLVTDEGEPLPAASVLIKGTSTATATNNEGRFSISAKLPAVLVFSSIGYETKELRVTAASAAKELHVVLKVHRMDLAEVLVNRASSLEVVEGRAPGATASRDIASFSDKRESSSADKLSRKKPAVISSDKERGFSKVLTAGELSDFKKWKLWGDYSAGEFSSMSTHWGLSFKQRYCVQVQNNAHRAMAGEKVYLIDNGSRDTVWAGITDNTGKAELWGVDDDIAQNQSGYSIICGNELITHPVLFQEGINRIRLKKSCAVSSAVDIAFVVDATGSMGDEIRYLQAELQDIIAQTSSRHKDVDLRLASVFYRDHEDDYLTRHIDFQSNPSAVLDFIKKQSAGGGGDFPEAVEDALSAALDSLQWRGDARAKIIFLVLDAPPHEAAKGKMKALIARAAACGIRIVPVACSGVNKSTEYLLRCMALATNGSYVFLTDDSGVGNPHIKPTTDEFKVELLNELLRRLIGEMIAMPSCEELPRKIEADTLAQLVQINVYPNPTAGKITIESSVALKQVYLTDFTGKLLMQLDTGNRKRRWTTNLSRYPSGTYLVRYFNEEKGWGSQKVVLVH